jgi:beta-phosphoglucomutase-like phosphatase (HAD superfamily)
MGCGYLSVIVEWDGVIVEEDSKLDRDSWLALAREEARPAPLAFLLRKMEGMKSEQAIAEVLCWSRDPTELRRLASRRDELFRELRGGSMSYQLKLGSIEFLRTLKSYDIPIALVSPRPRKLLEEAMEALPSLQGLFRAIVSAEDVCRGKPDPEMYMYAAQLLGFIPERCIVVGSSNSSVEGAHDTFMKCIAVSGKHPVYELGAADLVVARLDDLSFVDLKNLADLDSPEFQPPEPQPELETEEEVEAPLPRTTVALADRW